MKRTTLNAIIDTIAFFPLLVTAITGIIIWLYLPRGLAIGALGTIASHQTFLGIQQQVWLDTHMYVGLLFTALVVIHLILHWGYIKSLPQRFAKKVTKSVTAVRRLHMRTPTLNAIIDTIAFFPLARHRHCRHNHLALPTTRASASSPWNRSKPPNVSRHSKVKMA